MIAVFKAVRRHQIMGFKKGKNAENTPQPKGEERQGIKSKTRHDSTNLPGAPPNHKRAGNSPSDAQAARQSKENFHPKGYICPHCGVYLKQKEEFTCPKCGARYRTVKKTSPQPRN
jgi:rubredoxin